VNYRWDWEVFLRDTGGDQTYLAWMMSSWGWTLAVAACAWIVALLAGSVVGTLRTVPSPWLNRPALAWVELFRNIPVLVQVFLWYHVVPAFVKPLQDVPSFVLVVFALGLFSSARVAEQVRAGIESLSQGQRYAALAMGLTLPQAYRFVLLPMAFRIVLPPLTSEAMNIIKNSSVAFAVSVGELTMFAMQAQEETSRGIEVYLAVTTLYAVSAFAVNRVMTFIEARVRVPGYVGGTT
jgi:glutamate/aspartate transport system permease protein